MGLRFFSRSVAPPQVHYPAPETEVLVKTSGRRFLSAEGSIAEEDSVKWHAVAPPAKPGAPKPL